MAFPLALIGTIAGGAAQGMAGMEANKATIDGAAANLYNLQQSNALNNELRDDAMEQYQPFYDYGVNSLSGLQGYMNGTAQPEQSQWYQYRQGLGENALQGQLARRGGDNGYTMNRFNRNLAADEEGMNYARLLDAVKIGQGNAGAAGSASQSFTGMGVNNALSSLNANVGSQLNSQAIQQQYMGDFGDSLGSYFGNYYGSK